MWHKHKTKQDTDRHKYLSTHGVSDFKEYALSNLITQLLRLDVYGVCATAAHSVTVP